MKYQEKETKTVLNIQKFINPWFWNKYSLSPYQGCEFNCIYCYARSPKYNKYFGNSNTIYIKNNIAKQLDQRLTRAKVLLPDIVGMTGVCDPYQASNTKFQLTRECLKIFSKHKWPIHIFTKSNLVINDIDILDQIAKNNWSAISFTITTTNGKIAKFLEPNAPLPKKRFETIKHIKSINKNILVGIFAIPIIPGLTDTDKEIENLIKQTKASKADYLLFSPGLTMDNEQGLIFLKNLIQHYPNLIAQYEDLYKFKYTPDKYNGNYTPKKSYIKKIAKKIFRLLEKYKIPYRIPRYIPNDYRKHNYLISEQILNQAYKLQTLGFTYNNLYWAGMNIQHLKESIINIAKKNELTKIRNVDKTIEKFIIDNLRKMK